MKIRESGMPDEAIWATFFEPEEILHKLGLSASTTDAVDFGCGYGTFTIPVAKKISGSVHAFDVDPAMIEATRQKVVSIELTNVSYHLRDFVREGSGLNPATTDCVMLFNILHAENPVELLQEAYRILRKKGLLAVIHWDCDPKTPRGPSMEIRPRPEQVTSWIQAAGFSDVSEIIDLPLYHYGIVANRGE